MPDVRGDVRRIQNLLRRVTVPDERPRVLPVLFRYRKTRRTPPPIVCLISSAAPLSADGLLRRCGDWLASPGSRRAVPRAVVQIPKLEPSTPDHPPEGPDELDPRFLALLQELYKCFSSDDTAMGPIPFPRYRTADWLMRQRLEGAATEASAQLRERLPELLRRGPAAEHSTTALGAIGGTVSRVLTVVLSMWPIVRLWLFVSSHVPGLSPVSYWFMHQRYLTPRLSNSFVGFGVRLAEPMRRRENNEQIAKLLVNAFLEDLRVAYRRRLWRPSSWRRTAYPVALLDGVEPGDSATGLMRYVNEIRNETGLFDPLALISRIEDSVEHPHLHFESLDSRDDPLSSWQADIDGRRRRRRTDSWYLSLPLPDSLSGTLEPFEHAELAQPPAPPWAARRSVVTVIALLPVAALVAATVSAVQPRIAVGCTAWPWHAGVDVVVRGTECIGLSAGAAQVFADDEELAEMEREVFRQNTVAARLRHDNPRRPLVTLIYFAGMTYTDRNVRYPHAQAEELAGLAVQQRRANKQNGESEPLLRIVIANGGSTMRYATWVVEHQISRLVRSDPTVVGVIGLDRSTAETRRAIARLGELGVPTMATTLSADGLDAVSPTYFQPVPDNHAQAELVAEYAAGARNADGTRRYDKVTVYAPTDRDDIYVRTLADDLEAVLAQRHMLGDVYTWSEQQQIYGLPLPCAPADPDAPRTLLFFAGRNPDFGPFVNVAAQHCGDAPPPILANDTATRAVSDKLVQNAAPIGFPVRYVAKGVPALLAGSNCVRDGAPDRMEHAGLSLRSLCAELTQLRRDLPHFHESWPGDRTGITFDVAELFLRAVQRNRSRPERSAADGAIDRAAIGLELRRPDLDADTITGKLRFDGPGGIATGASIGVLVTSDLNDPDLPPKCLVMYPIAPERRTPTGCPAGTESDGEKWEQPTG
ncbi:hypothetical protein A5780_08815 [Nocardia sp. 852002-20019_SCH5090214]|uniref:Receptor ligand binding region domain-containing protein n=1 Tax=Nocardia nova TaxID=37330 RepID=A0A2S6A3J6_9NOCA|nr:MULTISPECIES: hypothetical protein [Nocardia]OBF82911.1 hypothetical protein A9X06_18235 [Mycobacterium sp. 852002-51759_SCH5129042]MBF6276354.1 hypothetical protein [Nocardia nova]OBA46028.1 hypothetical protein A5789_05985 [Nocardia sp. 852002-51101_SCH5132738]OBA68240.1 hypothetical protein A5780_08815 [Nocardia sp. 852002-20019_SCH5090214]OBB38613.1 hypothetical protein A5748_02890 [Nocardia sp. 852002-51244_SCH5132740]